MSPSPRALVPVVLFLAASAPIALAQSTPAEAAPSELPAVGSGAWSRTTPEVSAVEMGSELNSPLNGASVSPAEADTVLINDADQGCIGIIAQPCWGDGTYGLHYERASEFELFRIELGESR